ncbi:MAG: type II secretion system protein M [Alphaproteobacteria bacterium]|nr:type II secretion system protein M [Alphaproteobacteria bacterium]HPF47666.1 type II secretion system protein M [Emcibacteraceae bacterium]HRW28957.1 type II secretion system protein M [Emcibacteraceae bacterium]
MKAFWSGLTERERLLICLCGALVAVTITYLLLIRPLFEKEQNTRRAMEAEKAAYTRIIDLASRAEGTRGIKGPDQKAEAVDLREAATIASKETGIAISRIQPGRDGDVSFWIDAAKTDQIFNWLLLMDSRYDRQVKKLTLQKNANSENLRGQFEFAGDSN